MMSLTPVMTAAWSLPIDRRGSLPASVANALQGREIGPRIVARACRELQREFFHPPDLSRGNDVSKWRR
jgi:hypothetical protein